jgi:GNAT superfamily N-acetyltransferase
MTGIEPVIPSPAELSLGTGLTEASDRTEVVALLTQCFRQDVDARYVFRSPSSAERWSPLLHSVAFDVADRCGFVHGAWQVDASSGARQKLVGVGFWTFMHRRCSLPMFRVFTPMCRLLPFLLQALPTYWRYARLNRFYNRLLPQNESFWLLSGLAVDPAYRGGGIGARLLQETIGRVTASGKQSMLLCWAPMVSYYSRFQFATVSENSISGIAEKCFAMAHRPE